MSELGIDDPPASADALRAMRQTLAADLHDGVGSALTYAKFRLPLLADAIAAGDRTDAERHLSELREVLGQAQSSLRELLANLRASADPLGLAHALERCALDFGRQSPAELAFVNEAPALQLPPEQQTELVQIAREALCNVARHAQASHASMRLQRTAQGVRLLVEDDGVGVAGSSAAGEAHHGLAIMRERASRLGAALNVEPAAGGGTRVQLELALPAQA